MSKKKTIPKTDFGSAGVRVEMFGKTNQFSRKLQIPWTFKFKSEPDLISLISDLSSKFTVMESISMGGNHQARIISDKTHVGVDIEISVDKIRVYPTTTDHQATSEQIYAILQYYPGELSVS